MKLDKKSLSSVSLLAILLALTITSVNAQTLNIKDLTRRTNVQHIGVWIDPISGKWHLYDFTVKLNPDPPTSCIFDFMDNRTLSNQYMLWDFHNSTGELPGSFDVIRYDAGRCEQIPPTQPGNWDNPIRYFFQVNYNNSGTPPIIPSGGNLTWIQIIYTNYPKGGATSPYVDPRPDDDTAPFAYSITRMKNNEFFGLKIYNVADKINMTFYDCPCRDWATIIQNQIKPMRWKAHLYAAVWNHTKTVTVVRKGVEWGFEISFIDKGEAKPGRNVPYVAGGVAGDMDWILGPQLYEPHEEYAAVGGIVISVDKLALLAPYIALASTILVATTATAIYVKHRKEKQ